MPALKTSIKIVALAKWPLMARPDPWHIIRIRLKLQGRLFISNVSPTTKWHWKTDYPSPVLLCSRLKFKKKANDQRHGGIRMAYSNRLCQKTPVKLASRKFFHGTCNGGNRKLVIHTIPGIWSFIQYELDTKKNPIDGTVHVMKVKSYKWH